MAKKKWLKNRKDPNSKKKRKRKKKRGSCKPQEILKYSRLTMKGTSCTDRDRFGTFQSYGGRPHRPGLGAPSQLPSPRHRQQIAFHLYSILPFTVLILIINSLFKSYLLFILKTQF